MSHRLVFFAAALIAGGCVVAGCGADANGNGFDPDAKVEVIDNGFESDDPSGRSASSSGSTGGADAGAASGSGSSSSSSSGGAQAPSGDSASRAIQEADIVKLDGNRLYALSQYGGLAIVDVTNPDRMQLLGRKRTEGMPFEFYVENGRAHIMLNDFGRWVDEGGGKWVQTSELLELDVTNPTNITEVGHYDVPGSISDSRLVGSTLYLVTMENGYCWGCNETPSTIVTSFGVGGAAVSKIDQIAFRAPSKQYSWWQRSVSATNQRMYIGGPSWSWTGGDQNRGSVIQVVDISDASGRLTRGADVQIAGNINSRWQMDEHEGVLRVVSQFGNGWWGPNGSINPRVQTFTVANASTITALGQTELVLPEPESLRSVRFDGVRGYAITAQQTDPLYTIDLSNPAVPKQAAALEMPGWIFHMEPRGDRLVGFGYEDTNWRGKLAVSLFDVSDLTKPTMLSRVAFGSGGGDLGEDQDRIHKAVRVLDQQGTILVPFASYGSWNGTSCERPATGIQIIDYAKTGLTLRGLAPYQGQPRRAMLLPNNRLLGMSDRNVSTFDLANRDAPAKLQELDLSNPAYHMVETTTHIAAITNDWWSGEAVLALTPKDGADDANAVGKVSLAELAEPSADRCNPYGWTAWYQTRLFANGDMVWLTVPVHGGRDGEAGRVVVAAIDTSNPAAPKIVGRTSIALTANPNGGSGGYYGGYFYCGVGSAGWGFYNAYDFSRSVVGSGDDYVKVGNKLAYLEIVRSFVDDAGRPYDYVWSPQNQTPPDQSKYHWDFKRRLHVVDFQNPASPVHEAPVTLPASLGTTPLHVLDGVAMTSRWVYGSAPGKVRFYMDRVDLKGATRQLASVNIPGSLLHVDAASSRIVTADYKVERTPAQTWEDCSKIDLRSQFIYDENVCVKVDRSFKLADVAGTKVTLRQVFTPPSQHFNGVELADDRIYVTHERVYDYRGYQSSVGPNGQYVWDPPVLEEGGLWAVGGLRAGNLSIVSELRGGDARWPLAASGTKVAVYRASGMAVFDTATPQPTLVSEAKLRGWGYSSNVLLSHDRAIASLGEWGLQTFRW